jgi:hypothetical protein
MTCRKESLNNQKTSMQYTCRRVVVCIGKEGTRGGAFTTLEERNKKNSPIRVANA